MASQTLPIRILTRGRTVNNNHKSAFIALIPTGDFEMRSTGVWIAFALCASLAAAAEQPPVGIWRSTGDLAFALRINDDGTGTHHDLNYATGTLSNPKAIKWSVDATTKDPVVYNLSDGALDRKGCRMHLNADNGNLSIRGNTEGEIWVLVSEKK
jgi:hypothetical protein